MFNKLFHNVSVLRYSHQGTPSTLVCQGVIWLEGLVRKRLNLQMNFYLRLIFIIKSCLGLRVTPAENSTF